MKEGYLQNKIRELDYKLKQQMELAEHLNKELQMFIDSKKEYKGLFNKLKELDKFKEKTLKEINKQNKIEIKSNMDQSHEIIDKHIHESVEKSVQKVKTYVDKEIAKSKDKEIDINLVSKNSKSIYFNEQLSELLIEELIKERIISNERAEIIKKRASIRAKEQE
jgi:conjugal transfer/entry exclusion protein